MPESHNPLKRGRGAKKANRAPSQVIEMQERFPCKAPPTLVDVKAVRREMARVYRFVWENKIVIEDATKLVFVLDKMIQAFKSEAELAVLNNQYQDAWSGVMITPPEGGGALLAAPSQEVIPPARENESDEE
jgi:hypothetical protein